MAKQTKRYIEDKELLIKFFMFIRTFGKKYVGISIESFVDLFLKNMGE